MSSRGRQMWEEHMKYILAKDIAGMVNDTFQEDAVCYHNFPFFDSPPPYVIKGKQNIIRALATIFERQGALKAEEPFGWSESDDHIAYQIIVDSPNTGRWMVTDLWLLRDGKITHYFGYGNQLPLDKAVS